MAKIKAKELAKKQREISVAEFFEKNRHLLGFDNKRKALLTTVKEAVDNSLDACEEAQILPELNIEIVDMSPKPMPKVEEGQTTLVSEEIKEQKNGNKSERFRIIIEDNGPGIIKKQVPNIFARLLYGSKFHSLKQSLTEDEPILIKQNGKIKIIPIGTLVDKYVEDERDIECNNLDIKVPCFDWKRYKYSFKPVSHLIKHKRRNEIYDIKTSYGKHIKVTGCHSVFTINKKTLNVEEVQARDLKKDDFIIAPKTLNIEEDKNEINILDYILEDDSKNQFWYLYTDKKIISKIFSRAEIIHYKKQGDKSRKYYRFTNKERTVDIVDDSYKQYIKKGFLPVWLVKFLDVKIQEGIIKTYFHDKEYSIPLVWNLTSDLMKLIGLFVAEGHTDKRQIGFTFSRTERDLVKLVCDAGFILGSNYAVEERPEKNCVRVKLFGGILSYLFRKWCGKEAKNKKIPNFVFSASKELRQDFLDYLYVGDGYNTKNRNQLMLSTVSKNLANQTVYLWLMQDVTAGCTERIEKGLGKKPSKVYVLSVYGDDINKSNYFCTQINTKRRRYDINLRLLLKMLGDNKSQWVLNYLEKLKKLSSNEEYSKNMIAELFNKSKIGYKLRFMLDNDYLTEANNGNYCITLKTQKLCTQIQKIKLLLESDFLFLPIKDIEVINEGHNFVYDLSVPENENFVGGFGAIACHNSRGQQGIGISAAGLYAQLTTGKPVKIISKISPKHPARYYELKIDIAKNEPKILNDKEIKWDVEHGTKIEMDIEGTYQKGGQSVDRYLKETAIVNPHVTMIYTNPLAEQIIFPRATEELPSEAKEIKPHPYGVELGILIRMLKSTRANTLSGFLMKDFSRVGAGTAKAICENASLLPNSKPKGLKRDQAEKLMEGIKKTKIMNPPTNCIAPIGAESLEKGLKKEIKAEFYTSVTRPPAVYRGNPFVIEVGIAYGGEQDPEKSVKLLRYANRVPLLYQQSACSVTKSVIGIAWRNYGLSQSKGSLPVGPCTIVVHMASVWVPFTSESKEAVAHYPEIIKEIKLALQECGRKLGQYVRKKRKIHAESKKRDYIQMYIPHVAEALNDLLGLKKVQQDKVEKNLKEVLEKQRGKLEKIEMDTSEYDEEMAKIGKEEENGSEEEKEDK